MAEEEEVVVAIAPPDLLVPFGPRAALSLVGAIVIIAGVWHADRTWDELGSTAYARAATALKGSKKDGVVIPEAELDKAFPFPLAFVIGWIIYGIANLFDAHDGTLRICPPSIISLVVSLALGWIASVPMGNTVRYRDAAKKKKLSLLFVSSWLILTIVGGPQGEKPIPFALRAIGAIFIIASMKVLWKFRKMGDSWEQHGMPNPNPVVYNAGGPMFVFGWFCFVVGMSAITDAEDASGGIPIYFTTCSLLAFLSGCGMVPVVLVVDYAHDEGAEFTGFGTDGRFFGRFWESPIPFLSAWTIFGLSSLFPFTDIASVTTLQWIILANCVLQGIDAGILIQGALYKGDMAGKVKYSIPFVLLFLALGTEIGLGTRGIAWFALLGAVLIILGQKTVFGNRKRGDYWMENGVDNPNPIVYSAGEPIFMAGWIIMWLTMSLPTH